MLKLDFLVIYFLLLANVAITLKVGLLIHEHRKVKREWRQGTDRKSA